MSATLVQHTFVRSVGAVGSVAIAFGSNVTAGNTIIAAAQAELSDIDAGDVTDTLTQTYVRDVHLNSLLVYTEAVLRVSASAGGANTVTLTAGASEYQDLAISEWSGMAASPVSGTGTGENAVVDAAPVTGSFAPSGPCTIVGIMAYAGTDTTMTPGATYTQLDESEDNVNMPFNAEYKQVAGGTYTADWALGAVRLWACCAAAYLDAAAPSASPPGVGVMMTQARSTRRWRM